MTNILAKPGQISYAFRVEKTGGTEMIGVAEFATLCYNFSMKQKPLIETNPYLRDPEKFRKALVMTVSTSTAIETGAPVASIARMLEESKKIEPIKKTRGSAR